MIIQIINIFYIAILKSENELGGSISSSYTFWVQGYLDSNKKS
jgi:hypothetical protein